MHELIHVHPNELQRRGLVHMLRDQGNVFKVVASVANAAESLAAMEAHPQAIVITEVIFGEAMDLTVLMQAKRMGRKTIVFSDSKNPNHILNAREENALDYIFFTVTRDVLIERLKRAATEGTQGGQFKEMRQLGAVELTAREKQVMRHLAMGLGNKEIGQALEISFETVKEHVQHIFRKLGVNDRTQAAVLWTRQNL